MNIGFERQVDDSNKPTFFFLKPAMATGYCDAV